MTIQVMQRSGGRRFGPTALAAQVRHAPEAPVVECPRRQAVGLRRTGSVGRAAPRGDGEAVRVDRRRRIALPGESTRPPGSALDYPHRPIGSHCRAGTSSGPYRMGRWARLAMTVVVTAAIVVAVLTVILRPTGVPTRFVTVQPGENLMSIVLRDMPGWDPSAAINAVESLNGLDGPAVRAGVVLRIPAARGAGG